MPPPVVTFPASALPAKIQETYDPKFDTQVIRRKDKIELEKCELLEMLQYECGIARSRDGSGRIESRARIVCRPVERFFRR